MPKVQGGALRGTLVHATFARSYIDPARFTEAGIELLAPALEEAGGVLALLRY